MDNVIVTQNLTRTFHNHPAVDQLDLSVPSGSVFGFLGPNGAGKTTTIRLLLGLIRPDAGDVSLFGLPFQPNRRALLSRVGALVETPSLYPHLTGRENLETARILLGVQPSQVSRVLHLTGLARDANRLVRHYSLGMRQRLGLAMAMINDPQLLILDEPTNGLDPAGIQEMREVITSLPRTHGATVFLSSHLLSEVEQMASHVGIIQKGQLIFQGTLDHLHARYSPWLELRSDRPEETSQVLTRLGWKHQPLNHVGALVEINGEADAAFITWLLVREGINLYHLAVRQPSLEEIFLSLTTETSKYQEREQ